MLITSETFNTLTEQVTFGKFPILKMYGPCLMVLIAHLGHLTTRIELQQRFINT